MFVSQLNDRCVHKSTEMAKSEEKQEVFVFQIEEEEIKNFVQKWYGKKDNERSNEEI